MSSACGKEESRMSSHKWNCANTRILSAMLAIFIAIAVSTRNASKISLFFNGTRHKSCNCSGDSQNYMGMIEGCCCDYETANRLNEQVLHPMLERLVVTPFFRYFKVKLWCDCPFWPDDGMCVLRDCSVCECPESEFPEPLKRPSPVLPVCREGKPEASVDRTVDTKSFKGWVETDNPWTNDDETDTREMTYVNLQLNPERYTGYVGPSAVRIWDSIYSDNCPRREAGEGACPDPDKVFLYRLISGLHTSISAHVAAEYLIDEGAGLWGPNPGLMDERVLRHPDRVRNLYFTFLFVLRALIKAGEYLEEAEYDTGNPVDDAYTQSAMLELLYNPAILDSCPLPFDEANAWKGAGGEGGREVTMERTRTQFKNVSALMDCVGCEKCRLWGKLQVLGLGTALKILFSAQDTQYHPHLQRNEVIALVNLLHRLSQSVRLVHHSNSERRGAHELLYK